MAAFLSVKTPLSMDLGNKDLFLLAIKLTSWWE